MKMICNPVHGQFPEIISILFKAPLIFGLFFCSYILCKYVTLRFYLSDIWKKILAIEWSFEFYCRLFVCHHDGSILVGFPMQMFEVKLEFQVLLNEDQA